MTEVLVHRTEAAPPPRQVTRRRGFDGSLPRLICASFYFGGTVSGLELAGQSDAAFANRMARLTIVIPSFVMFARDAFRILQH